MRNFIKFHPNVLLHLCPSDTVGILLIDKILYPRLFFNELVVEVLAVVNHRGANRSIIRGKFYPACDLSLEMDIPYIVWYEQLQFIQHIMFGFEINFMTIL